MTAICGVYKITEKTTGLSYIGQSKDIFRRLTEHTNSDINEWHKKLNEHPEDFTFEILETCSPQLLDEREKYYIQMYNTYNNGFNLTPGNTNIYSKFINRSILADEEIEKYSKIFAHKSIINVINGLFSKYGSSSLNFDNIKLFRDLLLINDFDFLNIENIDLDLTEIHGFTVKVYQRDNTDSRAWTPTDICFLILEDEIYEPNYVINYRITSSEVYTKPGIHWHVIKKDNTGRYRYFGTFYLNKSGCLESRHYFC